MTFLKENGFNLDAIDEQRLLSDFLNEMMRGLHGEGDLPMLPSGILLKQDAPRNVTVPTFDVGGTNLRSARVTFDAHGKVTFTNIQRGRMPGSYGLVDMATFYSQLCDTLQPNLFAHERFGFCFSYPTTEDGTLLFWTKKIQAPEIPGRNVAQDLLTALEERNLNNCSLQILNDTVAALLATYTLPEAQSAAGIVGFILGTGTNTAYTEITDNITKRPHLPRAKQMPINCESGNFNRFPKSAFDLAYEKKCGNGHGQWEHCISGVHLGSLGTLVLHAAAESGLLPTAKETLLAREFTNIELDTYCSGTNPTLFPYSEEEACMIRQLLLPIYERAALFAAVNIAAAGIASARARGKQEGTICINADGSTFWKTSTIPFAERVTQHVTRLLTPYNYTCNIVRVEEAPLLGAALAALNG
ncbi:MAG: hypothetical protein IJV69_02810 [Kiritimatiellae bacterium]|nr:hypothetical protein [Kiritimatiellia bacterium]